MSPDAFRKYGYQVVDWIASYYENIEKYPVQSNLEPGAIRKGLPETAPMHGEHFEDVLTDIDAHILPGITHWQSPHFYAFFPANTSGPAILGDLLSSGLGVQGMLWATSPACTELESHVLDWLVDMLDLPEAFKSTSTGGGVIQDTASSASLCALLAAREHATRFTANVEGCNQNLVAYTSSQAHSSIAKAAGIAGIGKKNLRLIKVNEQFEMCPEALQQAIEEDRSNGYIPFFVCATLGTTSSLAIDPIDAIGKICNSEGIWLHVDGAMAGTAALCPEYRYLQKGMEYADSYCFNPHKWMLTNFDCSCFFVKDREALIRTFSINPEYLKNAASESGEVFDYRDWHVPLGRRFRALKLWFVIRFYGVEGLQQYVREHIKAATAFATKVEEAEAFSLVVPPLLNLVCFRHRAGEEVTRSLLERLNASGKIYLTHTRLGGVYTIRLCVGQSSCNATHVMNAWKLIQQTAQEITGEIRHMQTKP